MADSCLPSWPIILNKSLEKNEIHRLLSQNHKVRVTDTTGQGVIIFPQSSVAFMVVGLDQVLKENQGQTIINPDIVEKIQGLNQLHRRAYVILMAAVMGPKEIQGLIAMQSRKSVFTNAVSAVVNFLHNCLIMGGPRQANLNDYDEIVVLSSLLLILQDPGFLGSMARFIPAHNAKECVDCMVTIAKVTCKPMAGMIKERMKRLEDATVSDNVVLRVLASIGLSNHGILCNFDILTTNINENKEMT